jgi:MFS family permease
LWLRLRPRPRLGDIFAVFSCGLTLGAFFWGIAVDVIGRKWAFNLTVGITALFGSLLGAMDSYSAIVGLTLGVGFGLGGNIPIDATITLEFLPQKSRYLLVALSAFQPMGVILTSLICWRLIPAYSCTDGLKACTASTSLVQALEGEALECCTKSSNYGWRYSLFTLGFLSVLAFVARFVLFHFRESPRFLITQGRDAEAVDVCKHVALTNGKTPTLTLSMLEAIDAEDGAGGNETRHAGIVAEKALKSQVNVGHLARLFSSRKMTTLTLLAWAVYMADHWGFTIAGSFLPKILAERGADQGVGIDVTYRN